MTTAFAHAAGVHRSARRRPRDGSRAEHFLLPPSTPGIRAAVHTATTVIAASMLASVFKVHRFVAGGFGLSLLLAPDAVNNAMAAGRTMPTEERLTLQSWAAFMIAFAGIVHAAPTFPPAAQRAIAKSLLACFVIETVVYAKGVAIDLATAPLDYKIGFASTGAIFAGLALAYGVALAQPLAKAP